MTTPRGVIPLAGSQHRQRTGVPADHLPPVTAAAAAPAETDEPTETDETLPDRWEAVLTLEGVRTDDHRMIAENALSWRDLPLPLMFMSTSTHGGYEPGPSHLAGSIETIERSGGEIRGTGTFDLDGEWGREAARTVGAGLMRWVSVDLAVVGWDFIDECEDPFDFACTDWYEIVTEGLILGTTIVPMPAFGDATIRAVDALAASARQNLAREPRRIYAGGLIAPAGALDAIVAAAQPSERGLRSLVAAGGPTEPPAEWFADPELEGPTHVTITDDGRVFGHVATWGTCHIGIEGTCTTPPESRAGYAYFMTGEVRCADGSSQRVGAITVGTGHAEHALGHRATAEHYDNTGTQAAYVAVGEDEHGIWCAGAVAPDATEDQIRRLRAGDVSGDWRAIGGALELVAVLGVNVAGFPVARTAAGFREDRQVSLVAAGVLHAGHDDCGCTDGVLATAVRELSARFAGLESIVKPLMPLSIERMQAAIDRTPEV